MRRYVTAVALSIIAHATLTCPTCSTNRLGTTDGHASIARHGDRGERGAPLQTREHVQSTRRSSKNSNGVTARMGLEESSEDDTAEARARKLKLCVS